MAKTRATLEQISVNVDESLGVREVETRPRLSPVASAKDIGRRAIRNFGKVDVDKVIPDPDQPRVQFTEDALQRLAQSIRDKGQLSPIRVRWSQEHQKWVIISGERRWRATRHAGLPTIDCYFHDDALTKSEVLEQQLIENLLREDLSAIEEGKAFRSLMNLNGWNGKQVAEALRLPPSKVSRAVALLDLPEDLQRSIEQGEIAARTAYEISKLTDVAAQRALAAKAKAGTLSLDDAARAVRKRKGSTKPAKKGVKLSFPLEEGWKVSVSCRRKANYFEVEAALEQSLEEVRLRIANNVQLL